MQAKDLSSLVRVLFPFFAVWLLSNYFSYWTMNFDTAPFCRSILSYDETLALFVGQYWGWRVGWRTWHEKGVAQLWETSFRSLTYRIPCSWIASAPLQFAKNYMRVEARTYKFNVY
jgi:hypothetical protein